MPEDDVWRATVQAERGARISRSREGSGGGPCVRRACRHLGSVRLHICLLHPSIVVQHSSVQLCCCTAPIRGKITLLTICKPSAGRRGTYYSRHGASPEAEASAGRGLAALLTPGHARSSAHPAALHRQQRQQHASEALPSSPDPAAEGRQPGSSAAGPDAAARQQGTGGGGGGGSAQASPRKRPFSSPRRQPAGMHTM